MKYSNELKVGVAIVLAAVVFILGVRFFQDLPLFSGTYALETEFENAAGLIAGNVVRVNGVNVGSVDDVFINPANNRVKVRFHVARNTPVPEGSETAISGLDALGVVRMDLVLGPPGGQPVPNGGFVPSRTQVDLLGELAVRVPVMADRLDSVLVQLSGVLASSRLQLDDPSSDVRRTLVTVRSSVSTLDEMLRAERHRVASVLSHADSLATGLARAVGGGDSLAVTVEELNTLLRRLDRSLESFDVVTARLATLLAKLDSRDGTLGLLVNDPGLYHRADSVLASLDALLVDFRANPGRYLREMRIVDLF